MLNLSSLSEQMLIHENACVAIDKDMPLDRAAIIGCAVTTGAGTIFNACSVTPGETVLGWLRRGWSRHYQRGQDRRRWQGYRCRPASRKKRELAKVLGATHTVDALADDAAKQIMKISGGGVDWGIEAVGRQASADLAVASLRRAEPLSFSA